MQAMNGICNIILQIITKTEWALDGLRIEIYVSIWSLNNVFHITP